MTAPWFRAQIAHWRDMRREMAGSGTRWPDALCWMDLTWWEDQTRMGYERRIPGCRTLARDWGVTVKVARRIMSTESEWKDTATIPNKGSDGNGKGTPAKVVAPVLDDEGHTMGSGGGDSGDTQGNARSSSQTRQDQTIPPCSPPGGQPESEPSLFPEPEAQPEAESTPEPTGNPALVSAALDVNAAWERFNDIHQKHNPRAQRLKLDRYRQDFTRCAKKAGTGRKPDYQAVVDAWKTHWTHPTERWERQNVEKGEWTPARTVGAFLKANNGFKKWLGLHEEIASNPAAGARQSPASPSQPSEAARYWWRALEADCARGMPGHRVKAESRYGAGWWASVLMRSFRAAGFDVADFERDRQYLSREEKARLEGKRGRFLAAFETEHAAWKDAKGSTTTKGTT